MKTYIQIAGIAVLIFLSSLNGFSKEYRMGAGLIYNFSTRGVGFDGRIEFPLKSVYLLEGVSIVPQLSYFPSFNNVREIYVGSSVHLGVYKFNKWLFYGLANVSYNAWANYEESDDPDARYSNLAIEGGLGVTHKSCVRPFLEFRVNAIGIEPNVRIGILYSINCERRGAVPCSKIPKQPIF